MNMNKKLLVLSAMLVICFVFTGCAKKKIISNYNRPKPPKIITKPKPPKPTLAEQLDKLYQNKPSEWKKQMQAMIIDEKSDLPIKHLGYAIQEFNNNDTRDICLTASYLYLKNRAKETGSLTGGDYKLFKEFVEYSLTHPVSRTDERIRRICRFIKDPICQELQ